MKKVLAITTAMILAVIMMLPAFAATNPVISTADEDHTYNVYQIFTGDVEDGKLTNVKYGKNGKGTQGADVPASTLEALAALEGTDAENSKAIATNYTDFTKGVFGTLTSESSVEAPTGYYLIKDAAALSDKNDAVSLYVIKVIDEDITFSPKSRSTTTLDKKIVDGNDKVDSKEANKNDVITFEVTVTLPDTLDNYSTYKVIISDTLSEGLTYQNDAKFYLGSVADKNIIASAFTKTEGKLEWTCNDVKSVAGVQAGSTIILRYSAKLTGDQVKSYNNAFCQYSNNPYNSAELGKTPEKKVYIYNTHIVINKVDDEGQALNGATFKLERFDGAKYVEVSTIDGSSKSTFEWDSITAGKYRITEISAPTGYNKLSEPIVITFSVSCDADGEVTYTVADSTDFAFDANGKISATIANHEGSVLPETGGMGTVIFTVLGSVLVIGAIVVFVSKKKAGRVEG